MADYSFHLSRQELLIELLIEDLSKFSKCLLSFVRSVLRREASVSIRSIRKFILDSNHLKCKKHRPNPVVSFAGFEVRQLVLALTNFGKKILI